MLSKSYFSQSIVAVLFISMVKTHESKTAGCAAPMDLPNKPFFVVWNHPTKNCGNHGIDLGFEKWGIVDNKGDNFIGEMITLFYGLGDWPRYSHSKSNRTAVNGGIPQLGNLSYHLSKAQSDVKTIIPNNTFNGLSVIDFEYWRPVFWTNFDSLKIYQEKSLELAKKRYPNYNKTQLIQEATNEFESAARAFVGKTLQLAVSLRPKGRWGYYGFPRCWGNEATTMKTNDKMAYIFNTSTGLYPSIYFSLSTNSTVRAEGIRNKINETLRVKAKWSPTDVAILPYAQNQNGPFKFFTPEALHDAIRLPADLGSSGVVLWGSSGAMHYKNECTLLQDYVNSTLGPYVLGVSNFFGNCTQQLCQGHGRCVKKEYEAVYQYHLRESGRTDCLIPEEDLKRKKRRKGAATGKTTTVKVKGKKSGVLSYESERNSKTLSVLRKLTSFENMLKTSKWKALGRNERNKRDVMNDLKFGFVNEEKEGPRLLNQIMEYTEEGMQKPWSNDERGRKVEKDQILEEDQYEFSLMQDSVSLNEAQSRVEWENDVDQSLEEEDVEPSLWQDSVSPYEDSAPLYDFDDYVCKCFAGWSGKHCEIKGKE